MSSLKIMSGLGVLAVLFGILSSFFTVDQTQQALVLQFGEPKRLVNKPGLNFKIPFTSYFEVSPPQKRNQFEKMGDPQIFCPTLKISSEVSVRKTFFFLAKFAHT